MKNFKDYVGKLLNESPYTDGIYTAPHQYEEIEYNLKQYNHVFNTYKKVQILDFNNKPFSLYLNIDKLVYVYTVLDENNKMFVAYFMITYLNKNNIQLGGVWNHPNYKGLITYIWNSFILLLDFKTIRCDGGRSKAGKEWFNKVILQPCFNQPDKYKCFVRNIKTLETFYPESIKDFDEFYGDNVLKYVNYRIYIEKL